MAQRRKFKRIMGNLPCRKLYVLAAEGRKIEPQYFSIFKGDCFSVTIKCLKGTSSSPTQVLSRMEEYIKQEGVKPSDEAWLIVDRD